MSNAWSHLPNADHIDWVFNSVKENPELWDAAYEAAKSAAWDAARSAAWAAVRAAARYAAWDAAWNAAVDAARDAAWAAAREAAWHSIIVLIAYDDCDQFLKMSYEQLQVWAALSEDPRAVLLLPMIYVKERLNEQSMVTSA